MIIYPSQFRPVDCEIIYVNQYAYADQKAWMLNTGFEFDAIALPRGDYRVIVEGLSRQSCGVLRWYMDDTIVENWQDWYGDTEVDFTKTKQFNIHVAESGRHTFKALIAGKNSKSSFYYWAISMVSFVRVEFS